MFEVFEKAYNDKAVEGSIELTIHVRVSNGRCRQIPAQLFHKSGLVMSCQGMAGPSPAQFTGMATRINKSRVDSPSPKSCRVPFRIRTRLGLLFIERKEKKKFLSYKETKGEKKREKRERKRRNR